jgi:prefoldin subunit 5
MARGLKDEGLLTRLDDVLVAETGEGFTTEESFATLPVEEVTLDYLKGLNITARGTANHIVALHRELHAQYQLPSTSSPSLAPGGSDGETAALTAAEKEELLSNMQAMKKELEKLRAATTSTSTSTAAAQKASGGQGGRGGLIQQQVQCNIRNPRTNQPYTMDELAAEIQRLQQDVAAVDGKVVGVAAAADERIAGLEQQHAEPQTQSGEAVGGKEGNMRRGWFKSRW